MAVNLDPMTVGGIIVGVLVALNSYGLLNMNRKVSEIGNTRILNNPLGVKLHETYATREECAACMRETKRDLGEMKALYDKILLLVMERDERSVERTRLATDALGEKIVALGEQLHERITRTAEEGADRRRRIHDEINKHGDRITRVETMTDVSKDIGQLGGAIMTLAKKKPERINANS